MFIFKHRLIKIIPCLLKVSTALISYMRMCYMSWLKKIGNENLVGVGRWEEASGQI